MLPVFALIASKMQEKRQRGELAEAEEQALRDARAGVLADVAADQGAPTYGVNAARQKQRIGQKVDQAESKIDDAHSQDFGNFYQGMAQKIQQDRAAKEAEEAEYRRSTGDLTKLRGGGYSRNPYG